MWTLLEFNLVTSYLVNSGHSQMCAFVSSHVGSLIISLWYQVLCSFFASLMLTVFFSAFQFQAEWAKTNQNMFILSIYSIHMDI